VNRAQAIAELPTAYAVALRLSDQGVDREAIARVVGIETEAVEPLLRLAHTKLAALLQGPPAGGTPRADRDC
jgi:DNA-directed RNA polymerase specialized sigma24 family protein